MKNNPEVFQDVDENYINAKTQPSTQAETLTVMVSSFEMANYVFLTVS